MSLSVSPLVGLTASDQYIAGVIDGPITSKLFSVVTPTYTGSGTSATVSGGTAGVPNNGMTAFPQLASVSLVTYSDGDGGGVNGGSSLNSGEPQVGYVKVVLAPAAGDTVNASSPMNYTFSPNALAIIASTSTG